jgi:photosystem II stability/assembly factor-like uncharacterized protein
MDISRSTDGGKTWMSVPLARHKDNHILKFAPGTTRTIFSANDGGLFKSTDGGFTWSSRNEGLAITQFYRLGISRTNPLIMVAGAQDNGIMKYVSATVTNIGADSFIDSDGMYPFIDWSDSDVIYVSSFGQKYTFHRSDDGGKTWKLIFEGRGRDWLLPWCQDPSVAETIYVASDKVYKSIKRGDPGTWYPISGLLSGIDSFNVLKVAPSNSDVIYAAGQPPNKGDEPDPPKPQTLYRTIDGGREWKNITGSLPVEKNFITDLAISDSNPDVAYVTFSGYHEGQKVYRTINGGIEWTPFTEKLPNMPVNTVVYQKGPNNAVYIGTDVGVYYRDDTQRYWVPYRNGLPNVTVNHLQIDYRTNTIRAATFGRGVWEAPLF